MVRCMMNGVIWNSCKEENVVTSPTDVGVGVDVDVGEDSDYEDEFYYKRPGIDVVEYERKRELKAITRSIKVVEDNFDALGHPMVKIIYLDASESRIQLKHKRNFIQDAQRREFAKLVTAENSVPGGLVPVPPPRLLFVTQDRDYWPGSENDPDATKRRALKHTAFVSSGGGLTDYRRPPDYQSIFVPLDEGCNNSETFNHFLDIDRPGNKFILENMEDDQLEMYLPHNWRQPFED